MSPLRIIRTEDAAAAAAALLAGELRQATTGHRHGSIAISGGETPWLALARLQPDDAPWQRIDVFQVDERIVPHDHPARNLSRLEATLLSRVPAIGRAMPVESGDLDAAAESYGASLPPALDIVQLGLGTDGHTASLIPGDPVLAATGDVGISGVYQGNRRMTLTFASINRARRIVWIITGAAKREMLAALIEGTAGVPANRVARENAVVIADAAALDA